MLSPLPQSPAPISVYHKRNVGSTEKDTEANQSSLRNDRSDSQPLSPEIAHELSSSSLLNKNTKSKAEVSSPASQAFWLIIWMAK